MAYDTKLAREAMAEQLERERTQREAAAAYIAEMTAMIARLKDTPNLLTEHDIKLLADLIDPSRPTMPTELARSDAS